MRVSSSQSPRAAAAFAAPLTDTPVFHWFVVAVLAFCFYMSLDGPWWSQVVTGLLLLTVLVWNTTLYSRATVEPAAGNIRIWRLTLFGPRTRTVAFDDVAEIRVRVAVWGERPGVQRRGTLQVCTLNDAVNVVYSSADIERVERLAADLRAVVGLVPGDAPRSSLPPSDLPDAVRDRLRATCEAAIDGDRILGPDALDEAARVRVRTNIGVPEGVTLWCFVHTAVLEQGRFGVAITADGLYWANDPDILEHTRLTRLSWAALGRATVSKDPEDGDILVTPTSQIGLGVLTDTDAVLTLLRALQAIVAAADAEARPSGH